MEADARIGADTDTHLLDVGADALGYAFIYPGCGYGGSCFPKDVKALMRTSEERGAPMGVLRAVEAANDRQKQRLFEKVHGVFGGDLRGKRIALWGLAFKANTDDMRESAALVLIEELLAAGARVVAHDPAAMHETERRIGNSIEYAKSNHEAATGANALVIVTDWNEYRFPDFAKLKGEMAEPVVIDGRNLYDPAKMRAMGFTYRSIGRGTE